MKESTITFTPKATMKKGCFFIGVGSKLFFSSLAEMLDRCIHRHPYHFIATAFLVVALYAIPCILNARAERDAALKKQYKLQQNIEQLEVALSTKQ